MEAIGTGAVAFRAGRPGRRPLARLDLRPLPVLPRRGARTSATTARFTGYHRRRRLRRGLRRRRAFLLSDPAGVPDVQAAPLLCAGLIGHRTLRMAGDPRRSGSGASAPRRTSWRRWRGSRGARSTPSRGRATPPARSSPGRSGPLGPGARTSCPRSRSTPRSSSRRSARSSRPRSGRPQGGRRRLRRHPHVRHPLVPLRAPLGGEGRPVGREPHAEGRRGVPRPRGAGRDQSHGPAVPARGANDALDDLRAGRLEGAAVLVP